MSAKLTIKHADPPAWPTRLLYYYTLCLQLLRIHSFLPLLLGSTMLYRDLAVLEDSRMAGHNSASHNYSASAGSPNNDRGKSHIGQEPSGSSIRRSDTISTLMARCNVPYCGFPMLIDLDSITFGYGSTDENGYRSFLVDALKDHTVDLIGEMHTGNMVDNHSEGRPGERINQTISFSAAALAQKPNVILVHVGSNDLVYDDDVINAPQRLMPVLERLFRDCPDALVLLSMLGPSTNSYYQARMDAFNRVLPTVAQHFMARGLHMMVVDTGIGINVAADLFDDLHPNDVGYKKMALAWVDAIHEGMARGWIAEPVDVSLPKLPERARSACPHNPSWVQRGRIASGDGNYHPARRPFVLFADLNQDGRADYLFFKQGILEPYLNLGPPEPSDPRAPPVTWLALPQIRLPFTIDPSAPAPVLMHLGPSEPPTLLLPRRDGYVDGYSLLVSQNPLASPFQIVHRGPVAPALAPDGAGVRFADLDGDGRPDYLYVHRDGGISAWLNRAQASPSPPIETPETPSRIERRQAVGPRLRRPPLQRPIEPEATASSAAAPTVTKPPPVPTPSWLPLGRIFAPPAISPQMLSGEIILEDIDGDGRADVLLVTKDGAVRAWANRGPGTRARGEWTGSGGAGGPVVGVMNADKPRERLRREEKLDETNASQGPDRHRLTQSASTTSRLEPTVSSLSGRSSGASVASMSALSPDTLSVSTPRPTVSPDESDKKVQPRSSTSATDETLRTVTAVTSSPTLRTPMAISATIKISNSDSTPAIALSSASSAVAGLSQKVDGGSHSRLHPLPQHHRTSASIPLGHPSSPVAGWMWEDRGIVASGVGAREGMLTRFADLNGDGRAEYLVVTESGETWAWKNGCD